MNSYDNKKERYSFSLEIIKCTYDPKQPSECKDDSDIIEFLNHTMITQYFLRETTDFRNRKKIDNNEMPLKTNIEFYQQFTLDFDKYRDNNDFVAHNLVYAYNERWKVYKSPVNSTFLSISPKPAWYGS